MKLADLFKKDRDFHSEKDIKEFIVHSKNYKSELESSTNSSAVVIFETSKQKTWLVSTSERLYCILDDTRNEKPNINWSTPKKALIFNNQVILKISSKDKTKMAGLVDIGENHKNWLYTKSIFKDEDIESKIKNLISHCMINA